ncbi:hypothetical protein Q7P36_008844 [Cladosporium allicinum]
MRISQPFCTIAKAQLGYAAALLTVVVEDDRVCYKTGGHQQRDITKRKDEVDIETQPEILQHPTRNEKADTIVVGHCSVLDGQRQQITNHHSKNSPTPPLPNKTAPSQLASEQCPFTTGFASKEEDSYTIARTVGHGLPALDHHPRPTTWPRQRHSASTPRQQQQTTRPTQCPFHAGCASEEKKFLYRSKNSRTLRRCLHPSPTQPILRSWTLAPKTAQEPHGHFLLHDSGHHRPPPSTSSSESWTFSPRRSSLINVLQVLGPRTQDDCILRQPTTPIHPPTACGFDPPRCRV